MKFYILYCGQMIIPDNNILSDFNTEQLRLVIPVFAYLLEHPKEGLVLIDTGFNYDHLPDEMKAGVAWSPRQKITAQLKELGYQPEAVKHVVISHLHFDHAGQMTDFPESVFHMKKEEWNAANPPVRNDYFPQDYMPAEKFHFEYIPECDEYDLFGDGSILCINTKGHSPGHQSFVINLPNTGRILLPVDAAHLPQYFETDQYYQDAWNVSNAKASIEKLIKRSRDCRYVIFGHDPVSLRKFKKAPEYYD